MPIPKQKRPLVVAALAAQAVIGAITVRDVIRRPADQIRGPKLLWGLWGASNTTGSAAYWLFGRRRQS